MIRYFFGLKIVINVEKPYISGLKCEFMEYYIDPVVFVAEKSGFGSRYVKNLLNLLDEGATIPFISRYRKEMTGSMDEVGVGKVQEIYGQFKELEKQ